MKEAAFHKFPSTPHLAWLGSDSVREDKIMTPAERDTFLAGQITLEEKIDGANLGLSFSKTRELRFQNRGNWLTPPYREQWQRLRGWAAAHETLLREHLPPGLILFGEWCYARHSVPYSRLPDWFIAFDVYDPAAARFWSRERRDELVNICGLAPVPRIAPPAKPTLDSLAQILDHPSAFGDAQREGIYLRSDQGEWLKQRAKLVNPSFVQAISAHWSKSGLTANHLNPAPANPEPSAS